MSQAYQCDKCGVLFGKSNQEISVPFKRSRLGQTYITVVVANPFDLCNECVTEALSQALDCANETLKLH